MKSFFIALCLLTATPVLAQTDSVTILNARILPTIWYSSLSAEAGNTVGIFAGIQNDSGTTFSGKANFTVNGTLLKSVPFQSKSGTVEKVGVEWMATAGKSTVVVTLSVNLDPQYNLVSLESDTSYYSVEKKMTLESVTATVKDALGTAATLAEVKMDAVTADASLKLDSFKKPEIVEGSDSSAVSGKVLGTSTLSEKLSNITSPGYLNTLWDNITNAGITALQYLLAHWKWTVAGIGVLSLAFVFLRR